MKEGWRPWARNLTTADEPHPPDRCRSLFDAAPNPMWVYDVGTLAFLAVNFAAVERYGYSPDEFLRMTVSDLHADDDRPAIPADAADRYDGFCRHRTKDGRLLEVEVKASPVVWEGRPAGLVLVVDDVTERKQLEDQLRHAQRMEAIGQFAGAIAHDFNNLLTAIQGYASLLLDRLPEDDEGRADVTEIARAGQRAAALTHQLLAFSRKQMLATRVLHLGDVLRELVPMLQRLIGEPIELTTKMTDTGNVRADAGQLQQVLMNLVVNARDAMRDGGKLTIEIRDAVVDEEDARHHPPLQPGSYVGLFVTDTGHGMDAATRDRVFEPFFTTKSKGEGTGLGLSTVYGIVKQSGGYTWVDSEPGRGATFNIYLPRTDEPVEAPPPPPASGGELRGTETILLVEDEGSVREFAEKVLRQYGYAVHGTDDPRRAAAMARGSRRTIHLLLTDVVLPEMSGCALAAQVLQNHPEARVLYMSGYNDESIAEAADPGTKFLQKPFTPVTLAQKVRETLDTSTLPQPLA
jgi:two-component system, cell cycle sensor histidine kinase and response regulator CckA